MTKTISSMITHDDLVKRAEKWLSTQRYNKDAKDHIPSCGVVLTEFSSFGPAIPDVIGFNHRRSVVIECKVSRGDFLSDQKKPHRGSLKQLGNYRYYLVLPHIVAPEETPEGWGLLYAFDRDIRVSKYAPLHTDPEIRAAEYSILYSIARRVALRELLPEIRKPLGNPGLEIGGSHE